MRPFFARCQLGLGRVHQRMGKCRTSEEYLKTAVEMFAGMGMGFWRAQAEASLTGRGGQTR